LFHLDLYRLETKEQILSAGIEDYLQPEGVAVIEWAERWFGDVQSPRPKVQSPPGFLRWANIETINETERRIFYEDFGA